MRQLLLLRHAKSSWDDPKLPDRERPLNARGRRAAAAMRRAMRELGLCPDVILVSPARRAVETLDALEPWDETPLVEAAESLYLANAGQMFGVLHGVGDVVRSVLLIGHNPGLHDLALALAAPQPVDYAGEAARRLEKGFPTAALAEFSIVAPWSQLYAGGGRLLRFLTPREVEAAG
ncbi:MAG: histidine phosphatase family protein [Acetobacteraceae bacterium]|nr:histidine phosphatase family protein [Acetobacteraceae bacterium]